MSEKTIGRAKAWIPISDSSMFEDLYEECSDEEWDKLTEGNREIIKFDERGYLLARKVQGISRRREG